MMFSYAETAFRNMNHPDDLQRWRRGSNGSIVRDSGVSQDAGTLSDSSGSQPGSSPTGTGKYQNGSI